MLAPNEWRELLMYFQQRHVLSHRDGFVDHEYIEKSGDSSYRVGQRLVVSEAQVLRMAELVEKLGMAMQADLPIDKVSRAGMTVPIAPPAFPPKIPGITDDDWKIYRLVCEAAVADDDDMLSGQSVWQAAQGGGMTEEEFGDSIEILAEKSAINPTYFAENHHIPTGISMTQKGWEIYFSGTMTTYQVDLQFVASQIVKGATSSQMIMDSSGVSRQFVRHALKHFESRGWVGEVFWNGGVGIVPSFTASLKRFAKS